MADRRHKFRLQAVHFHFMRNIADDGNCAEEIVLQNNGREVDEAMRSFSNPPVPRSASLIRGWSSDQCRIVSASRWRPYRTDPPYQYVPSSRVSFAPRMRSVDGFTKGDAVIRTCDSTPSQRLEDGLGTLASSCSLRSITPNVRPGRG